MYSSGSSSMDVSVLRINLAFGIITTILLCTSFLYLLVQIELSKKLKVSNSIKDTVLVEEGSEEDVNQNQSETGSSSAKSKQSSESEEDKPRRPRRLPNQTKYRLAGVVSTITLFSYLLLVFLPSGSIWLSFLALAIVVVAFLKSQIRSELRRQRYDRLSIILSLIIFTAASLSIATHARLSLKEGNIYEGAARIVGYDLSSFDNQFDGVTRTDLVVEWGSDWGCPDSNSKTCQASVNGALCEAKDDDRRFLESGDGDDNGSNDGDGDGDGDGDENGDGDQNNNDNADNNVDDALVDAEEEIEELEEEVVAEEIVEEVEAAEIYYEGEIIEEVANENLDLYYENEELQEENQQLENENANQSNNESEEELEEEVEQLEDELQDEKDKNQDLYYENEILEGYAFSDDAYGDDYWSYDWTSLWGDYACEDLFDNDLEDKTYDPDEPPGNDDWPFINIYGKCNSCDAYILDYYSSKHYNDIQDYLTQALYYSILGIIGLLTSVFFKIRHYRNPKETVQEAELLTNEGGTIA